MEYKKYYTPEEMKALADWFTRHRDELPQEMMFDQATKITDVPFFISTLFQVYAKNGEDRAFSGQFYQLFLLKQRLVETGIADD